MTLEETRLDLAVQIAVRAADSDDLTAAERIAAFQAAYGVLQNLDAGNDDWTAETLTAAWKLVRDTRPRGAGAHSLLENLVAAHEAVVSATQAPPTPPRRKRRRDA